MTWDPDTYPDTIRDEVHDYDELQEEVVRATLRESRRSILELGVGAGETARRVLEAHPHSHLTGIDSSAEMLRAATRTLPAERVTLIERDLAAPLPDGPFDLVVSALAIHHLEGAGKAKLFRSVRDRLTRDGSFVMGDVIAPDDPTDVLIEIEPGYDFPDAIEDQLRWLAEAGLSSEVVWTRYDLVVVSAGALPP